MPDAPQDRDPHGAHHEADQRYRLRPGERTFHAHRSTSSLNSSSTTIAPAGTRVASPGGNSQCVQEDGEGEGYNPIDQ